MFCVAVGGRKDSWTQGNAKNQPWKQQTFQFKLFGLIKFQFSQKRGEHRLDANCKNFNEFLASRLDSTVFECNSLALPDLLQFNTSRCLTLRHRIHKSNLKNTFTTATLYFHVGLGFILCFFTHYFLIPSLACLLYCRIVNKRVSINTNVRS